MLMSVVLQGLDHILLMQLKKAIIIMLSLCLMRILVSKTIMEKATLLQAAYDGYGLMAKEPQNV